jgi:hypothetical protein
MDPAARKEPVLPYIRTICMVYRMKTTLNIDPTVMKRLREEAARRGTTMSELVEAGLRRILSEPAGRAGRRELPPFPVWRSGGARVDVADRDALYDAMDER